jgi:hypothetical protein
MIIIIFFGFGSSSCSRRNRCDHQQHQKQPQNRRRQEWCHAATRRTLKSDAAHRHLFFASRACRAYELGSANEGSDNEAFTDAVSGSAIGDTQGEICEHETRIDAGSEGRTRTRLQRIKGVSAGSFRYTGNRAGSQNRAFDLIRSCSPPSLTFLILDWWGP